MNNQLSLSRHVMFCIMAGKKKYLLRGAGLALASDSLIVRPSNCLPFSFNAYIFQTTKDTSNHIPTPNVTTPKVKNSNLPSELLLQKQTQNARNL